MSRFYTPDLQQKEVTDAKVKRAYEDGWLPSVTTILDIIRTPSLEGYLIRQAVYNFRTTGSMYAKSDDSFSDFGSVCHNLLECHIKKEDPDFDFEEHHMAAIVPMLEWMEENVAEYVFSERKFVNAELGYAGTMDCLFRLKNNRLLLGDFKFKKNSPTRPMKARRENAFQLAAYRQVINLEMGELPDTANFLLASTLGEDPTPTLIEIPYGDTDYFPLFDAAHRLWKDQKLNG